jgi:hypothetical protein
VAGSYEQGDKPSSPIKGGKSFDDDCPLYVNRVLTSCNLYIPLRKSNDCHDTVYLSKALQPFGPWPLFQFLNLYTVGRTHWKGNQPVARPRSAHRTTKTQNKRIQTSMPLVRFEPTIPVFKRTQTVHALDGAATAIGSWYCHRAESYVAFGVMANEPLDLVMSSVGRQIITVQNPKEMLHLGSIWTFTDTAMMYHFEIMADKLNIIGICTTRYVHINVSLWKVGAVSISKNYSPE